MGVDSKIAEHALAHVVPGVEAIYDRHHYLAEKREAFAKLAELVERIKPILDSARVVPRIRQRVAAGMAQHMCVGLEAKACGFPCALDHPTKPRSIERSSALGDEDEGASAALALMLA
jgi:hypothetical protein